MPTSEPPPLPEGYDLAGLLRPAEPPAANREWWLILTPTAGGELFGLLIDQDAKYVYSLTGSDEKALVDTLAQYADPTVDVTVAPHGWGQTPEGLEERYRAGRSGRR